MPKPFALCKLGLLAEDEQSILFSERQENIGFQNVSPLISTSEHPAHAETILERYRTVKTARSLRLGILLLAC